MKTFATVTSEDLDTAIRAMGRDRWDELWSDARSPRIGHEGWVLIAISAAFLLFELAAVMGSPSIRQEDFRVLSGLAKGLSDLGYLQIPIITLFAIYKIRNYRQVKALRTLLDTVVAETSEQHATSSPVSANP